MLSTLGTLVYHWFPTVALGVQAPCVSLDLSYVFTSCHTWCNVTVNLVHMLLQVVTTPELLAALAALDIFVTGSPLCCLVGRHRVFRRVFRWTFLVC